MRTILICLLGVLILHGANCLADNASLPLTSAVGLVSANTPRSSPVTQVEVSVPNRSDLDTLVALGVDIATVHGNIAVVFATADEIQRIRDAGFVVRQVLASPQPLVNGQSDLLLGSYHNYDGVTAILGGYASNHVDLCRLTSIGQSVQGRQIWALVVSTHPSEHQDRPVVAIMSTIHGNEPVGTELCLNLADYLIQNYPTDPRISNIVASTELWIMPLLNPDGLELHSRYNAQGIDLNRSFPEGSKTPIGNLLYGPALSIAGFPPETAGLMAWSTNHNITLGVNYHTGALVVNYPYDNDGRGSAFSPSPDEALFESISTTYSEHNQPMWNSVEFEHGIVNGAAWYAVTGGLQDWSYRYAGCNAVTIELSDTFQPPASSLPQLWADNRESILAFVETSQMGVRGVVTDEGTDQPIHAAISLPGVDHYIFSDAHCGDYHRMLLPGRYDLRFSAPGYATATVSNVDVVGDVAARVDVALKKTNSAPLELFTQGDRYLYQGQSLVITNLTSGGSGPVIFALGDSPPGACINSINGVLTWSPMVSQTRSTNTLTIVATDSGQPAQQAIRSFNVVVLELPRLEFSPVSGANGPIRVEWTTVPGMAYAVEHSTDLGNEAHWSRATGDVAETGGKMGTTVDFAGRQGFVRLRITME